MFVSSFVKSVLYISEGSFSHNCVALNSYTSIIQEHISYELNFDVQQFENI